MRKRYNSEFKSKVAVEAIRGRKTMAELSSDFEVHRDLAEMEKDRIRRASRAILM